MLYIHVSAYLYHPKIVPPIGLNPHIVIHLYIARCVRMQQEPATSPFESHLVQHFIRTAFSVRYVAISGCVAAGMVAPLFE